MVCVVDVYSSWCGAASVKLMHLTYPLTAAGYWSEWTYSIVSYLSLSLFFTIKVQSTITTLELCKVSSRKGEKKEQCGRSVLVSFPEVVDASNNFWISTAFVVQILHFWKKHFIVVLVDIFGATDYWVMLWFSILQNGDSSHSFDG